MKSETAVGTFVVVVVVGLIVALIAGIFWAMPQYNVYSKEKSGEAKLKEATFSRQIAVEEAQAELDAASLLKEAEVIRAQGAADSVEIIGQSLEENPTYIDYLFVNGLHNEFGEIIYIPTEANMPILEAGRLQALQNAAAAEGE